MWDNATIMMLVEGTFVTLYMTLVSTFMGYVLGLPMGIALVDPKAKEMSGKRCIRIVFTENSSFEPVIANMVLECKAPVNILLADTKDIGGIAHGQMILQLPEDEMAANKMIPYFQGRKLGVEELKDYVG